MKRKLAFYSNQKLGIRTELDEYLLRLIGKENPRIGYIPSSIDSERIRYAQQKKYYEALGADLDIYFGLEMEYQPEKIEDLLNCDAIHLSGGSTYNFLFWLRKRELISTLREYVSVGGVLIGVSAGAILMTPEISTTHLCGEKIRSDISDRSALELVDFAFLPHLDEVNDAAKKMIAYYTVN